MTDDAQHLLELNRLTFEAESRLPSGIAGRPWDEFLRDVLAEDFLGRRAKPSLPDQDRDAFVEFAESASDAPRIVLGQPAVWLGKDLAVISSEVRLGQDESVRYRNVKAFVRRDGWRCVYWQVTTVDRGAG